MAASSSSPPSHPTFLAQKGSALDLFQRLRDGKHLTFEMPPINFFEKSVTQSHETGVWRINLMTTQLYASAVLKKMRLGDTPAVEPHARLFVPLGGEYVPIEFDTLVLIWLMVTATNKSPTILAAIKCLKMVGVDLEQFDLIEFFDVPKAYEAERMPLELEDLFSILLNAFFVDRRSSRFVSLLLVDICSPVIAECEEMKGESLLVDKHCYEYNGRQYWMTLYGSFCNEYIGDFMTEYINIWSINGGRYV